MLLKAELHCHIEGAAPPELAIRLARKYGVDFSDHIQDGVYVWNDPAEFLAVAEFAASLIRTEDDHALLAESYLTSLARDGAIYSELLVSPDHAASVGLSPQAYVAALEEGLRRANAKTGIEARLVIAGLRQSGVDAVEAAARFAAKCARPLVAGFGLVGDERAGDIEDFVRAVEIAREARLGITIHAGQLSGWESAAAAIEHVRPSRIGHGVRAVENPDLVKEIAERGIVLEICPGSDVALGAFPDFARHPLPQLRDAGCRLTLNTGHPALFRTSLAGEYARAAEVWGLGAKDLNAMTRTALEAAFVDRATRAMLLARLEKSSRPGRVA